MLRRSTIKAALVIAAALVFQPCLPAASPQYICVANGVPCENPTYPLPLPIQLSSLHGVVTDETGAVIPHVKIRITSNGPPSSSVDVHLEADQSGAWTTELGNGIYFVHLEGRGFATAIVPVQVTKESETSWKGFRLIMQPARSDTPPSPELHYSVADLAGPGTLHVGPAHHSMPELQTKKELESLAKQYDLTPWMFTNSVLIDEDSIPHSHPMLTLHTRHLGHDDELLSTFLHEQLHWWLDSKPEATQRAVHDLKKLYSKVPIGYPDGANDEESSYLHLIVCYLEGESDKKLLGDKRADAVMNYWANDHYRWIYKTVISDHAKVADIVQKNGLDLSSALRSAK